MILKKAILIMALLPVLLGKKFPKIGFAPFAVFLKTLLMKNKTEGSAINARNNE